MSASNAPESPVGASNPADNADYGRGGKTPPTPFQLTIGDPHGLGNVTMIGGMIRWGERGWLVSNAKLDYQAPGEMSQVAAVLEWLRRFFRVADVGSSPLDPFDDGRTGTDLNDGSAGRMERAEGEE